MSDTAPQKRDKPNYDFDNDRRYAKRRGWHQLKMALKGQNSIDQFLEGIERIARTKGECVLCPRLTLAVALCAYVTATRKQRLAMLDNYFKWADASRIKEKLPWSDQEKWADDWHAIREAFESRG